VPAGQHGPDQLVRLQGRELRLTNLRKVLYPKTGFTKADVVAYYAAIAPAMVPHLKGRPLNLKRYPDGVDAPFFFQKEAPSHRPEWLHTVDIWSDTKGDEIRFVTCDDAPSLVWLANAGNLEFHTLLAKGATHTRPTMMVFDLDPGDGVGLLESAGVALLLKDHLDGLGLKAFPKVSGGKGVQPYVPLNTPCTFEDTRNASLAVAEAMERQYPHAVVSNMRKELRRNKVLIDWSQNSHHKSTVCAYSLRARDQPSVSAPVTWDEVEAAVDARDTDVLRFSPQDTLERVERLGDLFAPVLKLKQHLPEKCKPASRPYRPEGQRETPSGKKRAPAAPAKPSRVVRKSR